MRHGKTWIVALGVLALSGGVVGLDRLVRTGRTAGPSIATARVGRATLEETVTDSGSVQPDITTIYAGTSGTLLSVPVLGAPVAARGELARIQNPQLERQATADEASLRTDRAALAADRRALHGAVLGPGGAVTVPVGVAGTVAAVDVQPGQEVSQGAALATLSTGRHLLMAATVDLGTARTDGYYGAPAVGQRAMVGAQGHSAAGVVTSADTSGTTTASVVVRFRNPGGIAPGTPGTVTLLPGSDHEGSALTVPGTVEASGSLTVAAPVAGLVVRIPLQPAQTVTPASTAALILDPSLPSSLTAARDAVTQDQAAVAYDRSQVASLAVTSPVPGVVSQVDASAGQPVGPGTPVAQVTDLQGLTATVEVDESDLVHMRVGQSVQADLPALSHTVSARILSIGPDGTNQNGIGLFPVVLAMPASAGSHAVLPGMTVEATFVIARASRTLSVPLAAVHHLGGVPVLLVLKSGRIVPHRVTVGLSTSTRVAIKSGATVGEAVVTTSLKDLAKFGHNFRVGGRFLRRRPVRVARPRPKPARRG